jgi:hypothetical protein
MDKGLDAVGTRCRDDIVPALGQKVDGLVQRDGIRRCSIRYRRASPYQQDQRSAHHEHSLSNQDVLLSLNAMLPNSQTSVQRGTEVRPPAPD